MLDRLKKNVHGDLRDMERLRPMHEGKTPRGSGRSRAPGQERFPGDPDARGGRIQRASKHPAWPGAGSRRQGTWPGRGIVATPFLLFVVCTSLLVPGRAAADQPRDWMVGAQPGGTYLNVDTVLPGAQLLIEHRVPVNGMQNEVDLRANALLMLPFYESQMDLDLRIVLFTVGASLGYRDTFRGLIFEPEESLSASHRRERDYAGDIEQMDFGFAEARFNLDIPFNDYVVWHNVNTFRYEDRPDRSFDWRLGLVHDGLFFKSDFHLFFKHRSFGALAPMVQLVDFHLDDRMRTLLNYGFFFVTRPGLSRWNDILLFTMLFNFGKTLGNFDGSNIYGVHTYYAPLTLLIAYRVVFDLDGWL
jgi:hypothetical protein